MTEPSHPADARIGQIAGGKYRMVRPIGKGGMGQVYEALHTVIGRRFAIKCLHAQSTVNPDTVVRFEREARAAGSIEHENIAAAVDFGTLEDGTPFLAMEYLQGEDLAQLLARTGPLPVPRATDIIRQTCHGLAAAHAREIVHRDLKPENLYICARTDGSDLIKVLDFGIAKLRDYASVTQTGATMGTACYMPIEQARGAKDIDQRADIYALGVILYEILAGKKPHPGASYNEALYHVITQEPEPLEQVRPGLPPGLADVVRRAMARDAADRFGTAVDLADALTPFADGVPAPPGAPVATVVSRCKTMPAPEETPAAALPHAAQPSAPGGQRRSIAPLATVLLAALLLVAGAWRRWHAPTSPAPPASAATSGQIQVPVLSSDSAGSVAPPAVTPAPPPSAAPATSAVSVAATSSGRPGGRPPVLGGSSAQPPALEVTPSRKNMQNRVAPVVPKKRQFDRDNPY